MKITIFLVSFFLVFLMAFAIGVSIGNRYSEQRRWERGWEEEYHTILNQFSALEKQYDDLESEWGIVSPAYFGLGEWDSTRNVFIFNDNLTVQIMGTTLYYVLADSQRGLGFAIECVGSSQSNHEYSREESKIIRKRLKQLGAK